MYKHIIVDTNNLFYRFYAVEKHKNTKIKLYNLKENNIYVNTIKNCLKHIQKIRENYLDENGFIYFLFDNPTSRDGIRKEIDESYKANRLKMEDDYYTSLNLFNYILKNYDNNFFVFQVNFLEADDLVKPLLTNWISNRDRVLLYSNDLDYSRFISDNVLWFDGITIYNKDKYKDKYNFVPTESNVCIYKAITGDVSDNIKKAVKNVSKEHLYKLLNEQFNSISDLLTNIHFIDYLSKEEKQKFIDNSNQLRINYELVRSLDCDWTEISEYLFKCSLNIGMLKIVYSKIVDNIKDIDSRDIFEDNVVGKNCLF